MTLKVGDRVRVNRPIGGLRRGDQVQVLETGGVIYPCRVFDPTRPGRGVWVRYGEVEKVESVPFKLERGDKVVNRKTGRRGVVIYGMVHDDQPPFEAPVPAAALEEYEAWHPGTYDLIKKDAPW